MTQPWHDPNQPPAVGQPHPGAPVPPPAPARRRSWFARHKVLTGLGALVVVAGIAGALGGGGDDAPPAGAQAAQQATDDSAGAADDDAVSDEAADGTADEPPAETVPAAAAVGTPVRDGKFEFTVTSVEAGVARIGGDFGVDAQGQFLLVNVTVTNIGDEAQYFDGSSQKLTDTAGRTHSSDGSAAIYLEDSNSFLNQINPGNSVEGVIVYDVPADAVPASIELHDSAWSGGVVVTLG